MSIPGSRSAGKPLGLYRMNALLLFICCLLGRPAPPRITIRFNNVVGNQPLQLASTAYADPFGEPMTIYKFKYYVSHISVVTADGKIHVLDNGCHLIDAADSSSQVISFSAPALPVRAIHFLLGVDSLHNISGAQSGDLDPLKGMFWTWNTGYVDAELEGLSDSSHANAHFLSWHVGGFRTGQNAAREIQLTLPTGVAPIIITADILRWFDGHTPMRISRKPVCHEPGPLAMTLADNYASMFSIRQ